jgi:glycosyltransferase involved in cell wall biosynthesis
MIQNIICTTKNKISESAGGALHVLGLANGFFRAGMNVSLICPDTNLDAARFKFKLFPLACDTGNKFTRLIKFEVKKFIKINGIVRLNRNNNALYMRGGVLHVAEYISSLLYDVPLIIEENDKKPWASLPVHWSGIDWLFELATNILYRRALVIVCVSEGLGRFIVNKYPFVATKTIVVNNGVDEDIFFPLDADECRQKINVPIGYYTIGYVGSLFKQRGVQFIIDAIRILREQRVPVIAIIVGDGAFRRDLQELANKYKRR